MNCDGRTMLQHVHALSCVKLLTGQAQSSPVSLNPATSNEDLREGCSGTTAWYPSQQLDWSLECDMIPTAEKPNHHLMFTTL